MLVGIASKEEEGNGFPVFGLVTLAAASVAVLFVGEGIRVARIGESELFGGTCWVGNLGAVGGFELCLTLGSALGESGTLGFTVDLGDTCGVGNLGAVGGSELCLTLGSALGGLETLRLTAGVRILSTLEADCEQGRLVQVAVSLGSPASLEGVGTGDSLARPNPL